MKGFGITALFAASMMVAGCSGGEEEETDGGRRDGSTTTVDGSGTGGSTTTTDASSGTGGRGGNTGTGGATGTGGSIGTGGSSGTGGSAGGGGGSGGTLPAGQYCDVTTKSCGSDKIDVLILGDSISQGYCPGFLAALGSTATVYQFAMGQGLGVTKWGGVTAAVNARTSMVAINCTGGNNPTTVAAPAKFDVIVFNSGIQDTGFNDLFKTNYTEAVQQLKTKTDRLLILDSSPWPKGNSVAGYDKIIGINGFVRELARTQGIEIIQGYKFIEEYPAMPPLQDGRAYIQNGTDVHPWYGTSPYKLPGGSAGQYGAMIAGCVKKACGR